MRSYNRFITDVEIEVTVDGQPDMATLYNLSCGGCMLEIRNQAAVPGTDIEVALRNVGRMPGRIVWQVDRNIGVQFDNPLHQKAVELVGFSSQGEDFDRNDPRDKFGLPLFG
ncbi:PilZ domain-containing protein [Qipengyuania sp. JC766]|uniref:PilZ domain-containing protein n=1 Tax=Qipengyuania sp. JC766 TaxID=3232139 RepID=UPI0034594260